MSFNLLSFVAIALLSVASCAQAMTAWQAISADPELTLYKQIILANGPLYSKFNKKWFKGAFLAPTNQAIKDYFYSKGLPVNAATFRDTTKMAPFFKSTAFAIEGSINFRSIPLNKCKPFPTGLYPAKPAGKLTACRTRTAITFETDLGSFTVIRITFALKVFKVAGVPIVTNECKGLPSAYKFAKTNGMTKLVAAIDKAGAKVAKYYKAPFAGTAFLPNNTAIDAYVNFAGEPTAAEWADILLYHVTPAKYTSATIIGAKNVTAPTALANATLTFINGEIEDMGYSSTAILAIKDVPLCGKGLAHAIDGVLLSE